MSGLCGWFGEALTLYVVASCVDNIGCLKFHSSGSRFFNVSSGLVASWHCWFGPVLCFVYRGGDLKVGTFCGGSTE